MISAALSFGFRLDVGSGQIMRGLISVRGEGTHYVNESPHKYRGTYICVCVYSNVRREGSGIENPSFHHCAEECQHDV